MPKEKTIYIIRHGETDLNRDKIVQGSGVDAGLNATGRAQANAFYQSYREQPFETVLTSGLRRTHETVAPFLQSGLPWKQFAELNEIGWGVHEGVKSTSVMMDEYHHVLACWRKGDFKAKLEAGESAEEMAARMFRFVEYLKVREEKHLLICSHGRAMRCLLCIMLEKSPSEMDLFQHSNTALYIFRQEGKNFKNLLHNDIGHLRSKGAKYPDSDDPSQNEATRP